jgi:dihydrofolate reductase
VRKLIESTFITLDGVISGPERWGPRYWDAEHEGYADGLLAGADAILLGRETYDIFAAVWPTRAGNAYADRLNALPKYVASTTLTETTWNTTLLEGDAGDAVSQLKQQAGGTILKFGTGMLDRTLIPRRLVDELHLWTFPVVAGGGQHLLEGLELTHLELLDTTTFGSGIVVHVYAPTDA